MNLFAPRKTPQEILRQHKRSIDRAVRDIDRERTKLEQQEKKLQADIKIMAKQNMNACKVMAKDLIKTRNHITKLYEMRTQMQAVGLKIQTLGSNAQMADAMKGVSRTMRVMNKRMKLPQIAKIMQQFEAESEILDMKQDMMNDNFDEMNEDEEEETEEVVQQVLDEIGIGVATTVAQADVGTGTGLDGRQRAREETRAASEIKIYFLQCCLCWRRWHGLVKRIPQRHLNSSMGNEGISDRITWSSGLYPTNLLMALYKSLSVGSIGALWCHG